MEIDGPDMRFSRRQEKNLLRIAAQIARSEFDSPERIGCPPEETLKLLARRSSSLSDSTDLIDHIATCSPCFIDYSRHRTAYKRRVRAWSSLACAALLFLCFLFVRSRILPGGQASGPRNEVASRGEPMDRTLDLRFNSVPRGDAPAPKTDEIPRLPKRRLALSIYLPTGSENGMYDIALVNASGRAVLTSSAQAMLRNYVEILPASVDLRALPAGRYELRIRRNQAAQWNSYLVEIE
jgi:hypothetical protein